jgi:hypothetical protein
MLNNPNPVTVTKHGNQRTELVSVTVDLTAPKNGIHHGTYRGTRIVVKSYCSDFLAINETELLGSTDTLIIDSGDGSVVEVRLSIKALSATNVGSVKIHTYLPSKFDVKTW